jgi:hypothetical protein
VIRAVGTVVFGVSARQLWRLFDEKEDAPEARDEEGQDHQRQTQFRLRGNEEEEWPLLIA